MPRPQGLRASIWPKFRLAVWLCAAMVIGLAAAFVLYRLPLLFGPVAPTPQAAQPVSETRPVAADEQVREAEASYADAMRDAATASDLAQRQHAEAMKAVAAARALAKDPESREAREALNKAMRDVQAMSEEASR